MFGEPFVPPVTDGSGQDRTLLRKAQQLLNEAGITVKDGKRFLPNGEPFTIEFLLDEPSFQPHHMPYIKNLGTLGIEASLRLVDPVQYRARVDDFDFDMTIQRFSFSATPGDSLRSLLLLEGGETKGSQNLAGIADPAIDALIEKIIAADSRDELTTACRASTACSAPAATGCRTGTRRRTGSPIGTCSRVPKNAALPDRRLFVERRRADPVVV